MEGLGIDFRLIIVQLINFGLLFFLLSKFLYKPILKILDERRRKIAESLSRAQKIEEEWAKIEEEKDLELERAEEAGKELVERLKREGEKQRNAIMVQAKEDAERMAQRARKQLILEKEAMWEKLKKDLAGLAILAAERIVEERISKEKREELLKQPFQELKKAEILPRPLLELPAFERKRISPEAAKIASQFLDFLKKTQSLRFLPEILEKLEGGFLISAGVITAQALNEEEQKKIIATLEEIFGKNLKIEFQVQPKILGGIIVKVGDQVFDNSLLGKTRRLQETL